MKGASGLGLLTGMVCQTQDYTLYPVVNAQNFVFAGYPALAEKTPIRFSHFTARQ